jgi:hypothetical protein
LLTFVNPKEDKSSKKFNAFPDPDNISMLKSPQISTLEYSSASSVSMGKSIAVDVLGGE